MQFFSGNLFNCRIVRCKRNASYLNLFAHECSWSLRYWQSFPPLSSTKKNKKPRSVSNISTYYRQLKNASKLVSTKKFYSHMAYFSQLTVIFWGIYRIMATNRRINKIYNAWVPGFDWEYIDLDYLLFTHVNLLLLLLLLIIISQSIFIIVLQCTLLASSWNYWANASAPGKLYIHINLRSRYWLIMLKHWGISNYQLKKSNIVLLGHIQHKWLLWAPHVFARRVMNWPDYGHVPHFQSFRVTNNFAVFADIRK